MELWQEDERLNHIELGRNPCSDSHELQGQGAVEPRLPHLTQLCSATENTVPLAAVGLLEGVLAIPKSIQGCRDWTTGFQQSFYGTSPKSVTRLFQMQLA